MNAIPSSDIEFMQYLRMEFPYPAYSGLIDRSKNAEIYASTEFNPKFFTTKLTDLHKQVGFVHAVLFNFPFSGVAVHYLDEANLPH